MKIKKVRVKNYRSIKDSGDILFSGNMFVLAGQNESGKSSILEALDSYEKKEPNKENVNFELENNDDLIQEISCTYTDLSEDFYTCIESELFDLTDQVDEGEVTKEDVVNNEILQEIKEFTLTRRFDYENEEPIVSTILDEKSLMKVKSVIKDYTVVEIDDEGNSISVSKPYLDIELYSEKLADLFFDNTPDIILFNDFTTILPDKILLSELDNPKAEGVTAVNNLEQILNTSFSKIAQKPTPQKNSTTETESDKLSATFQQDWQQKIYGNNNVNIVFFVENNDNGEKEISFYVETKDNEFLAARKRSKGMMWFLSLWLELKAKENEKKLVLLFDEPGLHLHIKANKDMLSVFHKLIEKGHQIVYSTHSPSLIETDKLHNIGLVINNEKKGTLVEGLTTSKINTNNKRDALQPVAEAMGMEPLKDFSILKERNVLLEGLSDFWYFKGMSSLLGIDVGYQFVPGIGIKENKIFHLISFCIGYGLDWLLVMDNGVLPKKVAEDLKANLFNGSDDELGNKVKLISEAEIENMFTVSDLKLIDDSIKEDSKKKPADIIGKKRKILFSRLFCQKVESKEIRKDSIDASTVKRFEEVFNWIEQQLN